MKFAKDHLHWTSKEWSKALFSDESKFCMFCNDGINYIRPPKGKRFGPKYQIPRVKHGGGNMKVWGSFSHDSTGPLHRIKDIMNQNLNIVKNVFQLKKLHIWTKSNRTSLGTSQSSIEGQKTDQ